MFDTDNAPNPKTVELRLLARTQPFKDVSMAQVGPLLKFCPVQELARGDKLFVPGQAIDKIYILIHGQLQVFTEASGDKPVAEIKPGECIGLASFVDRQPSHVTMVCASNCHLLPIDERLLLMLVNTPTVFARNLLFMLMKYMREKAAREAANSTAKAAPAAAAETRNLIDAVTGLHNQRWMDETLNRLTLRSATDSKPLSVMAIDLFQPADLVAAHGQEILNPVMHEIAGMLRALIRPTDILARHDNGRFVLMLPDTDLDGANIAASRIEESINGAKVVLPDGRELPPLQIVTGNIMMKAFVAGRKLVGDAFLALDQKRDILLENIKALAAAETARLAAEAAAALEAERLAAETAAAIEAERLAAEAAALEAERLAAETAATIEAQKLAEATAALETGRLAAESAAIETEKHSEEAGAAPAMSAPESEPAPAAAPGSIWSSAHDDQVLAEWTTDMDTLQPEGEFCLLTEAMDTSSIQPDSDVSAPLPGNSFPPQAA